MMKTLRVVDKTTGNLTGVSTFGKFEMLVGTAIFVFDMVSRDGDG